MAGGDVVAEKIAAYDSGDEVSIWIKVRNDSGFRVPSFDVDVFGTKNADWKSCNHWSLLSDYTHVHGLNPHESKYVRLSLPRGWGAYPGELFIVLDSRNLVEETTEKYNITVLELRKRNTETTPTPATYDSGLHYGTPSCILDEIDPVFETVDGGAMRRVVAEVL